MKLIKYETIYNEWIESVKIWTKDKSKKNEKKKEMLKEKVSDAYDLWYSVNR